MTATPKLIQDYFAATRAMDVEAYLAAFAPDAINYDPVGGDPLKGKEAMRQFFLSISGLFDRVGLTEEFVTVAGNEVAVKWKGGGISKNGKAVIFEGIDIFELNSEGLIQTLKAYWDPAEMMAKL
ncbi:MAG: SnoaL-like domain-containing protein [Pseudanabaena sp. RU_4_16]|nr:SnoaL-like domain-containing protein [Pseudanabaena sp. RU_4_16]NKB17445.1 SnoaL-like domain-containing protein [Pseudanabaena sp. CRU_2_10]